MAATDEISSTEKLLELIRSRGSKRSAATLAPGQGAKRKPPAVGLRDKTPRRGAVTVGVDIGPGDMKLVAVDSGPDRKPRLVKWAVMAMPPEVVDDPGRQANFLRSALTGFCQGFSRPFLWAFISSARVEIRFLKVPKVRARQLGNAVLFAFRKETAFDEKVDIFDYYVIGESQEDNTAKLRVMASIAPRQDVEALKQVFAKSGYPLEGVSIVPCALQNLLRVGWVDTDGQDACALFIGRDWSRIAIFSQGTLVLSRDIKAGMQSMVETIHQGLGVIRQTLAVESPEIGEESWDPVEPLQPDLDSAWQVLNDFLVASDTSGQRDAARLSDVDIFGLIRPALDRIVRQVELTFEHYHQNFSGRRVHRLFISGQVCHQTLVGDYFRQQLGLDTHPMDPFSLSKKSANGGPDPGDDRTRNDFAPAVGLALARHCSTLNFLHTYQEKAKTQKIRGLDAGVLAFFALAMVVCIALYGWLGHQNQGKARVLHELEQRLAGYSPKLDRDLVLALAGQTARQIQHLSAVAERYRGTVTVKEIGHLTPQQIRLINLTVEFGPPGGGAKDKQNRYLLLDGIVGGERPTLDATLAGYVMQLSASPMFGEPVIEKRSLENMAGKEVLRFAVRIPLK